MKVDDLISLYVGKVVRDKKNIEIHRNGTVVPASIYERELDRDQTILDVLKCAKANGFTGEA